MSASQLHAALKAAIRRAIIVMDALGDSEMRFRTAGQVWARAIDTAAEAYGYTETRVRFIPTAREIGQAEVVADWLCWLGIHEGPQSVPRLVAWAHDDPIWRIAEREGYSERTIHNRIDRSVAAILNEFLDAVAPDIPEINEAPLAAHLPNFMTQRPHPGDSGAVNSHGKCYIAGVGFMRDGKPLRNGHEKIDRVARHVA